MEPNQFQSTQPQPLVTEEKFLPAPKSHIAFRIGLVALLIVVSAGLFLWYKKPAVLAEPIVENTYQFDYGEGGPQLLIAPNYPSSSEVITVPNDIAKNISIALGPNNQIEDLKSVGPDPIDSNKLIFATADRSVNRIYSYDVPSQQLELLYTAQNTPDIDLMELGTQGSKVIFDKHIDETSNVCYSRWDHGADSYVYVDLNDIGKGLLPFIVPPEKIAESQKSLQECMDKLDSSSN